MRNWYGCCRHERDRHRVPELHVAQQTYGVLTNGSAAETFLAENLITGNDVGVGRLNSGQNVFLCGDFLGGNTLDGSPTSTVTTGCG